jgi:hypothetical protein
MPWQLPRRVVALLTALAFGFALGAAGGAVGGALYGLLDSLTHADPGRFLPDLVHGTRCLALAGGIVALWGRWVDPEPWDRDLDALAGWWRQLEKQAGQEGSFPPNQDRLGSGNGIRRVQLTREQGGQNRNQPPIDAG